MQHITTSNKYFKNITMSLDAIVLALYFAISPFEDLLKSDYGTLNKYFAMLVVVLILFRLMKREQKMPVSSSLFLLPLLLVFVSWMSALWSVDTEATVSRNMAYTSFPCLFVVIYVRKFNLAEVKFFKKMIIFGGMCSVFYMLYNYDEYLTGTYTRMTLTEGNDPNNLAASLLLPFWVLVSNFIRAITTNKKQLFLSVISMGLLLFGILITGSRGAFIAMLLPVIYLGIFYNRIKLVHCKMKCNTPD